MKKLDIIKSYWKAEGEKDLEKILTHFTEQASFSSPTMELKGKENIKEFYQGMIDNFKKIDVVPSHFLEQGNEIAVEYSCKLVKPDGREGVARGFNLFEISDNKIEKIRCYFNPNDFE